MALDLTVVIPTRNAARSLPGCLAALRGFAATIVVDAESGDDTRAIAESAGARVLLSRERSPARQRNEGIAAVGTRWVLCVDADEHVGPELRDEIARVIGREGPHAGFFVRRATWYLGKRIRFSGWREDRVLRLFRTDAGRWQDEVVHEKLALRGSAGVLAAAMEHHSYESLGDVIEKLDRYSTWGARELLRTGRRAGPLEIAIHPPARFIKTYLLKGGFLDGKHGIALASFSAYGVLLRYAKAWEMRMRGDAATAPAESGA